MDGILKCKCARRERGCASWRFPSIIVGGAAAIPRWREVSSEPFGPARASSRPWRESPSRRAGARAIIVCQVEVRLRAKFRSFPRKRAYRSKIWVPAMGSPRRERRGVPLAGTSAREWTTARRVISLALLMVFVVATAAVAQTAVDLQLVLAVDTSGSVDQIRFELQKRGYVAAFRHPRVLQAVRSGPNRAIGVTTVQWTGPALQVQVVGVDARRRGGNRRRVCRCDRAYAAPAVRWRHLDQRRHRSRGNAVSNQSISRESPRHRRVGRRLQQPRPAGYPGARRGGRSRDWDQRLAHPRARA